MRQLQIFPVIAVIAPAAFFPSMPEITRRPP
jgi:hypothetical protein